MNVYAILIQSEEEGVILLPNYFNTYNDALAEVKRKYPEWDDRFEPDGSVNIYANNKVEVPEGHKMVGTLEDTNLTELYIERGINISIRRLVAKPAFVSSGGYSRRLRKRNNKNSKKRIV